MTQAVAAYEQYEADFRALSEARSADPQRLRDLRAAAFARFQELGFPVARKANEPWKYTDVRPIAAETFPYNPEATGAAGPAIGWDDGVARVAFVNGRYSPELSTPAPDGLIVLPLAQAIEDHGDVVERHLAQHAPFADEGFTALNTSFAADGAFVLADRPAEAPLHIVYLTTERAVTYPRTLIVARPTSELLPRQVPSKAANTPFSSSPRSPSCV